MPHHSLPTGWREVYHTFCGPQVVASVLGVSPRMAAEWLVRIGALASDGQGTHPFGLACALGSRELHLARWHDRPPHTRTAWPTVTQFLRLHNRDEDEFVIRAREHVVHAKAGRIICDVAGTGGLMRAVSVIPIRQSWPRCPCAEFEGLAAWLDPFTRWTEEAAA